MELRLIIIFIITPDSPSCQAGNVRLFLSDNELAVMNAGVGGAVVLVRAADSAATQSGDSRPSEVVAAQHIQSRALSAQTGWTLCLCQCTCGGGARCNALGQAVWPAFRRRLRVSGRPGRLDRFPCDHAPDEPTSA
ncbi:hypothetical protein DF3PB_4880002 [uncultured Defluviicoccus sp.]|uniref:Uncharacterized protein n=1 Tax=metagenome TaxID=256318 RepID=A0A380TGU0_9ZZZZ|nr:hypothetical protein DF3PB_4880002 [uncultured Defluviicoccus sp.]